jgi:hypothetical protein
MRAAKLFALGIAYHVGLQVVPLREDVEEESGDSDLVPPITLRNVLEGSCEQAVHEGVMIEVPAVHFMQAELGPFAQELKQFDESFPSGSKVCVENGFCAMIGCPTHFIMTNQRGLFNAIPSLPELVLRIEEAAKLRAQKLADKGDVLATALCGESAAPKGLPHMRRRGVAPDTSSTQTAHATVDVPDGGPSSEAAGFDFAMDTPPCAEWGRLIDSLSEQLERDTRSDATPCEGGPDGPGKEVGADKKKIKGKRKHEGSFYRALGVFANVIKQNRSVLAAVHEMLLTCPALAGHVPQRFSCMRTGVDFKVDWSGVPHQVEWMAENVQWLQEFLFNDDGFLCANGDTVYVCADEDWLSARNSMLSSLSALGLDAQPMWKFWRMQIRVVAKLVKEVLLPMNKEMQRDPAPLDMGWRFETINFAATRVVQIFPD